MKIPQVVNILHIPYSRGMGMGFLSEGAIFPAKRHRMGMENFRAKMLIPGEWPIPGNGNEISGNGNSRVLHISVSKIEFFVLILSKVIIISYDNNYYVNYKPSLEY